MNKLRQRLKLETASVHQQLHRLSISKKLLTGEISAPEYAKYLEAHRYFYQVLDNHFYNDQSGLIAKSECFVDWLKSDLGNIAREYRELNQGHVYDNFSSIVDRSLASELGYAYVKYGSMFGAGVILSALQKKSINDDRGPQAFNIPSTVYFSHAVSKQKIFWERFESALCEYVSHEEDDDLMVQSAIKSFEMVFSLLGEGTVNVPANSQLDKALVVI